MMAAYALAPVFPARAVGRRARIPFVKQSLIQIVVCVLPSMLAVGLDRPRVAAIYLLSALFSLQLYCIVRRNPLGATTLAVGTLPAWMLLRDYFYYTAIEVVLGICVLAWIEGRRSDFRAVCRDRTGSAVVEACSGIRTAAEIVAWVHRAPAIGNSG